MAPPREKIGYVLDRFPAPSETFIRREVEALAAAGRELVLFVRNPEPPPADSPLPPGLKVVPLGPRPGAGFLRLWRASAAAPLPPLRRAAHLGVGLALARQARLNGVGRLHAHFAAHPAFWARAATELIELPYTVSAHAHDLFVDNPFRAWGLARARGIACCTRFGADWLKEAAPEVADRIRVIRHGVAPAPEAPGARAPNRVLVVGRLVEKKGFAVAAAAGRKLRESGARPDLELTVIGAGEPAAAARLSAAWGPGPGLTFAGALPAAETRAMIAGAAVLAAPSVVAGDGDRDNLPNVILEALAAGTPVVASALAGIPEAVRDNETGWLVPPGDESALARALDRVLAGGEAVAAVAARGRELVAREHDPERQAAALEAFLDKASPSRL